MMSKLLLGFLIVFSLTGCNSREVAQNYVENNKDTYEYLEDNYLSTADEMNRNTRFQRVDAQKLYLTEISNSLDIVFYVFVDTETGVEYLLYGDGNSYARFRLAPLYDTDGNLKVNKNWSEEYE